jgi:FtsP/CotA-like multicopper oxidase with cupredoxin domain
MGAGVLGPSLLNAQHTPGGSHSATRRETGRAAGAPVPVETPDVPNLPHKLDNGVKVFHLVAEPVRRELVPGRVMDVWGFNGMCPGPTIQVTQGDRVRVILDNHLPEPTSIHWHGFEIPIAMDGMPYISQEPVPPGGRFVYEFTLHQEGTFFYHSHGAMQEMMGMVGMFVMHPKRAHAPRVDRDFGIILQGWAILPNNTVPNTAGMEFNWLTFNGRSGPHTTPMLVRLGDRVRIRMVNLSMDHHPIHLHGHTFYVTGSEGGRQPEVTWGPGNTVLVGVAQSRDIEFVANNPGDWMVHCHLPHHMMNNMSDLMGERMITTSPLTPQQAERQMDIMQKLGAHGTHGGAQAHPRVATNATSVPGFPQDAFMEMVMDQAVTKPETFGLVKNWTAGMMGMMSLLRVLPPEQYERIVAMKQDPHEHQHQ